MEAYQTKLKQKTVQSIFLAAVKSVKKKAKESDAVTFHQHTLYRKALKVIALGVQ